MTHNLNTRTVVILLLPLFCLMVVFFLWPLGLVGWTSIYDNGLTLEGYSRVATSSLIHKVMANTLEISVVATLTCLVLGYAIAMHLSRMNPRRRALYLVMVMLPFWTSILVKSFAFTIVLGNAGVVNQFLQWVSGGSWHVDMLFNRTGVVIGMTNYLLPFMVLPIMASLMNQNWNLHFAAQIMGAGPLRIFTRITLPLSLPGVFAGTLMCLTLSLGMYITPALLGGRQDMMLANLVDFYTRQTLDWTLASAIAIVLLVFSGALILMLIRAQRDQETAR